MKCPECGYNQKVKYGLRCSDCNYLFTFNPKESHTRNITDNKFLACVRRASHNNTLWFTQNQLYAAFCKQKTSSLGGVVLAGIIALIATLILADNDAGIFTLAPFLLWVVVVFGMMLDAGSTVTRDQFDLILSRWKSSGKKIDYLIQEPTLHQPPPQWNEPDIYDYGVERILIVERDVLVDLFVKNNAHAEQRMLVISENGYPDYLVPVARNLLAKQPDLPIFLLHDATQRGAEMATRIQNGDLLPIGDHPIKDLGMFPKDFQNLKRTRQFDTSNQERALPVDAMMTPFLVMGLDAALTSQQSLGSLIEQRRVSQEFEIGQTFG